jgi:hypothetical protein
MRVFEYGLGWKLRPPRKVMRSRNYELNEAAPGIVVTNPVTI